ncbi:hypothetical protein BJX63DRAFT_426902 [Aspergillus granulosus]|uniref:Uncharacterized protein n=1 Tax=Aspergillus granulosus TaxID=176169 RepID=A0ABR4I5V5_9EURO
MEPTNGSVPWSVKRLPEEASPTSREQKDGAAKSSPSAPVPSTPLIVPDSIQSAPEEPQPEAPPKNNPAKVQTPHNLRTGAARGTRSANHLRFKSCFEWDAIGIEKRKFLEEATSAAGNSNPGH